MSRRLTLFDLDNTLLAGDSDHAFGEFLIQEGLVDAERHRAANNRFYRDYEAQTLDIDAYVRFTLGPVLHMDEAERQQLQARFSEQIISSMVTEAARKLVDDHLAAGDYCIIITATNEFVTRKLAATFSVHTLLATELEVREGRFTGNIKGTPCYQEGKVTRVQQWLQEQGRDQGLGMNNCVFYSDSINDLPLLERASEPVVVNPDAALAEVASTRGWRRLALNGDS